MKDNLWHIYDYEINTCFLCNKVLHCAIWQQDKTANFRAVCGYCDKEFKGSING